MTAEHSFVIGIYKDYLCVISLHTAVESSIGPLLTVEQVVYFATGSLRQCDVGEVHSCMDWRSPFLFLPPHFWPSASCIRSKRFEPSFFIVFIVSP